MFLNVSRYRQRLEASTENGNEVYDELRKII
jgi:hypothetical protein